MHPAYVEVASNDMKDSALNLRKQILENYEEDIICNTAVSCDGTWQRRGYASLNGVVSAVSIDTRFIEWCSICYKYRYTLH